MTTEQTQLATGKVVRNDATGKPLNGLVGISDFDIRSMNAALKMATTDGGIQTQVKELHNPVVTVPVNLSNELTKEQAAEAQSIVADKLLEANGWSIINKLALIICELLQTTQLYVLPVFAKEEQVIEALGDQAESFVLRFAGLRDDLANVSELLLVLSKKHATRTGEVALEDLDLVAELTTAYSNIQTQLETKVGPEMLDQIAILEEAGISAEQLFESFMSTQEQPE